jgi:hypothetical protein
MTVLNEGEKSGHENIEQQNNNQKSISIGTEIGTTLYIIK